MSASESVTVRCGRCGRPARISIAELQELRTFDCVLCLTAREGGPYATHVSEERDDRFVSGLLTDWKGDISRRQLSILLRMALGFSNEEIMRAYGASSSELQELLQRVADLDRHRK